MAGLRHISGYKPYLHPRNMNGKSPVANINPLVNNSDVLMLGRHIREMEHFKAWAEKVRFLNSVYGDGAVRKDIKQFFPRSFGKGR